MTGKNHKFPDDKTAPGRRKDLTDQQVKDLELAGGVEGGMPAGSAGGPGSNDEQTKDAEKTGPQAKPE